jgi:glucokinase
VPAADRGPARRAGASAPRRAAFALATVIGSDPIRMSNRDWLISRAAIEAALGLGQLILHNDFEALALALPHLRRRTTH